MSGIGFWVVLGSVCGSLLSGSSVRAEDAAAPKAAQSGPEAVHAEVEAGKQLDDVVKDSEASKKTGKKGRKRSQGSSRDKDAEGTEAPNRFEADPIIHSHYHQSGQPLEVDPD